MAFIVSACGRQVTPDRAGTGAGGLSPGFMSVKFRVNGTFNFSQYQYMVVFNTTGDGTTPRANGQQTNYVGYSFALSIGGSGGSTQVIPYQYYRPPGAPSTQQPVLQALPFTPQQVIYIPNSNGQGTEFTVIFDRNLFFGIGTPAPSSAPSASPSASPSPSPSGSPSASPSPTPIASNAPATVWNFNYFVAQPNQNGLPIPVDSLGIGGPNDTSYQSANLDTTQSFDTTFFVQAGNHPSDPSAQISGGEIANNP